MNPGLAILPGTAEGPVLASEEGLSFWGGVDPATGTVIDAHHPLHGRSLAGAVLVIPTSRGSCSGSGLLLDLLLARRAPAALVFREAEDVLTLGALVAARLFDHPIPVLRLPPEAHAALARAPRARITTETIEAPGFRHPLAPAPTGGVALSDHDRRLLAGADGEAARLSMEIMLLLAALQGAPRLTDVTRAHIDGCILNGPANLRFAERMEAMGARVRVPTTINAISVDRDSWPAQGVPPRIGKPASRLADAYVRMGAAPTFTCAPYHLPDSPMPGESLGWAESNAVVYANSVLGARSPKHPDYLDLMIAVTGRAPLAGVYLDENRRARRLIRVEPPEGADDGFWPLLGHLAGALSPDRVPLLAGLKGAKPGPDDLQALCAAFGTTSGAPMLHLAGHTPEAIGALAPDHDSRDATRADLLRTWEELNAGPAEVDLIALGSPHLSAPAMARLADLLDGRRATVPLVVTTSRGERERARAAGTLARLEDAGALVVVDLCWCSVTEPILPTDARTVMTNSGKYAHYGPGLAAKAFRFGSLADCAEAAVTGCAPASPPAWLR